MEPLTDKNNLSRSLDKIDWLIVHLLFVISDKVHKSQHAMQ